MKVIKNKILKSIKGQGGGKADIDEINYGLMPPKDSAVLQSKEFVKSLDLLCEGPIEGIVDEGGNVQNGSGILKGIYLNDTPILTSQGKFNFGNISADYVPGTEYQEVIPRQESAIIQKELNFGLLGNFAGRSTDFTVVIPTFNFSFGSYVDYEEYHSHSPDKAALRAAGESREAAEIFANRENHLISRYAAPVLLELGLIPYTREELFFADPFRDQRPEIYRDIAKQLIDVNVKRYRQRLTGIQTTFSGSGYADPGPTINFFPSVDKMVSLYGYAGGVITQPTYNFNLNSQGSITNASIADGGKFVGGNIWSGFYGNPQIIRRVGQMDINLDEPWNGDVYASATGTGQIVFDEFAFGPNGAGSLGRPGEFGEQGTISKIATGVTFTGTFVGTIKYSGEVYEDQFGNIKRSENYFKPVFRGGLLQESQNFTNINTNANSISPTFGVSGNVFHVDDFHLGTQDFNGMDFMDRGVLYAPLSTDNQTISYSFDRKKKLPTDLSHFFISGNGIKLNEITTPRNMPSLYQYDARVNFPEGEEAIRKGLGIGLSNLGIGSSDIREGGVANRQVQYKDYAAWNLANTFISDRTTYTHLVKNPNVRAVQYVLDIARLNDTQHIAEYKYRITEMPGLFGGDLKIDLNFRNGMPIDLSVNIGIEYGLLNTNIVSTRAHSFVGTTAFGYLVEVPEIAFDPSDYQSLKSQAEFANFSISELKQRHPRYVRIFKKDFETDSSLINRVVKVAYVKDILKSSFRYPGSAMVGTVVDSSNFDSIPDRSYDVKLLKAFVPANYEPLGRFGKDKRFVDKVKEFSLTPMGPLDVLAGDLFSDPRILRPRVGRGTNPTRSEHFGRSIAIGGGFLAVADKDYGASSGYTSYQGQIHIYSDNGYGEEVATIKSGTVGNETLEQVNRGGDAWADSTESIYEWIASRNEVRSISDMRDANSYVTIGETARFQNPQPYNLGDEQDLILNPGTTYQFTSFINAENGVGTLNTFPDIVKKVSGIVIGGVYEFNATVPDVIFHVRRADATVQQRTITIINTTTSKLFLKIFPAQIDDVQPSEQFSDDAEVPFSIISGGLIKYEGIIPSRIYASGIKLVESGMDGYYEFGDAFLDISKKYIICDAKGRTNAAYFGYTDILFIAKRNRFGGYSYHASTYVPFRVGYEEGDTFQTEKPMSGQISKDETIAVALFVTLLNIGYQSVIKIINLLNKAESTIFVGDQVFHDRIHGRLRLSFDNFAYGGGTICCPDSKTIIMNDRMGAVEFIDHPERQNCKFFTGVYRRKGTQWSLDQVIIPSNYRDIDNDIIRQQTEYVSLDLCCDAVGKYLVTGYGDARMGYSHGTQNEGVVNLFKYNGKNYEFIEEFTSRTHRQLTIGFGDENVFLPGRQVAEFRVEVAPLSNEDNLNASGQYRLFGNGVYVQDTSLNPDLPNSEITGILRVAVDGEGSNRGFIWTLIDDEEVINGIPQAKVVKQSIKAADMQFTPWAANWGGLGVTFIETAQYGGLQTMETPLPNFKQYNFDDGVRDGFGENVKISLDEGNNPIIAVSAYNSAPDPQMIDVDYFQQKGAVYIIKMHPNKDQFITDNVLYHIDGVAIGDPFVVNDRFFAFMGVGGGRNSFAISDDGKTMAVTRNAGSIYGSSVNSVQLQKLKQGTPTRIYENELFWNGMLQRKWTDNPAWIIYDLLTNYMHGAGAMIDAAKDVNIFNFYDIGRYFDSVNDDGYFAPLYDERGNTEPRLSCNFLVKKDYNAFDLINAITDLFFGGLYIENGRYNLWADRPTESSWAFTNSDVLDGSFTYSERYKQDKVTVVKVPFLDKYESFKKKIEYVEDGKLLREYGKIEKELSFTAFTSRSQARRYGKQFLYNSSYETEMVSFQTNDSALFLSPGDVIDISDELRNFSTKKEIYSIKSVQFEEKLHIVDLDVDTGLPEGASLPFDFEGEEMKGIKYSETSIKDGRLSNASPYNHIRYTFEDNFKESFNLPSTSAFIQTNYLSIKANSQGVPYIFAAMRPVGGSGVETSTHVGVGLRFIVLKKSGNTFEQIDFTKLGFGVDLSSTFITDVIIDPRNDDVIIPFVTESAGFPQVGYFKYSGGDFTNKSNWQTNIVTTSAAEAGVNNFILDQTQYGSISREAISQLERRSSKIVGQINKHGTLYLLIHVGLASTDTDSSGSDRFQLIEDAATGQQLGGESKYILYTVDTATNAFTKEEFGKEDATTNTKIRDGFFGGDSRRGLFMDFDMTLVNGEYPGIAYQKMSAMSEAQIRYRESSSNDTFVWGSFGIIKVFTDRDNNIYITHADRSGFGQLGSLPQGSSKHIYFAKYESRFDHVEWERNRSVFSSIVTDSIPYSAIPLAFLQNKSLLTINDEFPHEFENDLMGTRRTPDNRLINAKQMTVRGIQTSQLTDISKLKQKSKYETNTVYVAPFSGPRLSPETQAIDMDVSLVTPSITLRNEDGRLYDNSFSIDVNRSKNLMVSHFEIETLEEAFQTLQFNNFRTKSEAAITDRKYYIDITGFEINEDFITLFPRVSISTDFSFNSGSLRTAEALPFFNAENSIVRATDTGKDYKQYRVHSISELDKNLYEITAKEHHSGKFNFIETYGGYTGEEDPAFNIGVPKNLINSPTEPTAVDYVTGTDVIGIKFVTGSITGAVDGIETKYRVGLTYPNGGYVEKEFEKDSDNLSPSNEPVTNFGFFNLPTFGTYDLTFKSLRNPESSSFIKKTFTIENESEILFDKPFVNEVKIESDGERIKVNVDVRDVLGRRMTLSSNNYYLTLKIQNEKILTNQRIDKFEFTLDELKEFTQKSTREIKFKAELHHDNQILDSMEKTFVDLPPKILNAKMFGHEDLFIDAEVEEFEKVRSIEVYQKDELIKTYFAQRQQSIYKIPMYDNEIVNLPKDEKLEFKIIANDAFGTSDEFNFYGVIPGDTSAIQRYTDSITTIYSAQYWNQFSGQMSNFESSNNQTGFYGNESKAICEVSSSMISGESGNIKLELNSNSSNNEINLNFKNKGYLSQKTIIDMSNEFYGVNISTESGVFEDFEFKVKKI